MKFLTDSWLARLAVSGCILLIILSTIPLAVADNASKGLWVMQVFPLLLVVRGVSRLNKRSLQWLGFIVMFFLVEGILHLFVPLPFYFYLGAAYTSISLLLFVISIIGIRRPVATGAVK